jgi:hypothetical protein
VLPLHGQCRARPRSRGGSAELKAGSNSMWCLWANANGQHAKAGHHDALAGAAAVPCPKPIPRWAPCAGCKLAGALALGSAPTMTMWQRDAQRSGRSSVFPRKRCFTNLKTAEEGREEWQRAHVSCSVTHRSAAHRCRAAPPFLRRETTGLVHHLRPIERGAQEHASLFMPCSPMKPMHAYAQRRSPCLSTLRTSR